MLTFLKMFRNIIEIILNNRPNASDVLQGVIVFFSCRIAAQKGGFIFKKEDLFFAPKAPLKVGFLGFFSRNTCFSRGRKSPPEGWRKFSVRVFRIFLYKKRRIYFFRFAANAARRNFFGPEKKLYPHISPGVHPPKLFTQSVFLRL